MSGDRSVAVFRVVGKVLARRAADNSVTVKLFHTPTDTTVALDPEEVEDFAQWLARKVVEAES